MEVNGKAKTVYMTIALIGLVSLMGDIVYEGGRGLIPDYLEFLGASALTVGIVAGIGDFFGYALRLVSGYLTDLNIFLFRHITKVIDADIHFFLCFFA